jgi:hypothetical protein
MNAVPHQIRSDNTAVSGCGIPAAVLRSHIGTVSGRNGGVL